MAYGAHEHYYAKYISVHKVSAPSDYLNLTADELAQYPALNEAIVQAEEKYMGVGVVSVHPEEWKLVETALGPEELRTLKVGDEYYTIVFRCSSRSKKLSDVPKDYVNVTEEELEEYPLLKKAKADTDKFGVQAYYSMSTGSDDWLQLEDFLNHKGSKTIEIGGEFYEFELTSELIVQKYYAKYYATLTEEELAEYPALKEAIATANKSKDGGAIVQVPPDEWERTRQFIGADNIKIGDEYYKVRFMLA